MKKFISILPFFILVLISGNSCSVKDELDKDIIRVGSSLPTGLGLPSESISLIVFFNADCPDCVKEMEVVNGLFEEYGGEIYFLAVGRDMNQQQIKDYYNDKDYYIPFQQDPDRKIFNAFANKTIPRCYLSKDGVIKNIWKDNPNMTAKDFKKAYEKIK